MIRTIVTPTQTNYNLNLILPDDYIGQEVEVILFKKDEGLEEKKNNSTIKLSDKYKGVFTKEDALSFNIHSQQMRNEWDNT